MSFHRAAVLALVAALVAPQSFAQDDLFVPIPKKEGGKSKKLGKRKTSKKATAKKPPAAAAAPEEDDLIVPIAPGGPAQAEEPEPEEDDLIVPIPSRRPATAKKPPASRRAPEEDDLIVPITPGKSELLVKLMGGVKGARLYVDNKEVGSLPLSAPLQVDEGVHTLVVRRPGFADFSRRVTAREGRPVELNVALNATAGVVTVVADVPGATATINGQPRGALPLNGILLKPGSYDIVVSAEGFLPEPKSLAVRAGRDYTVTASLRPDESSKPAVVATADRPQQPVLTPPPPAVTGTPSIPLTQDEEPVASSGQPWFKRWYVWAGVGAVVTAATVGTVMATRGDAPLDLRSNPDESVCGGRCDAVLNGNGIIRF
ncbi:MAG: PEGA domain-containing protein [Myxococcaceae bacterium]|nr:PEGA domain-containing protein [Myxococcaceae bacterium]